MSIADKLSTIAENEQKVYEAGYNKGTEDGIAQGEGTGYWQGYYEYRDMFWDNLQDYGKRTVYSYAFGGAHPSSNGGWNDTIFSPKYNMQPTTANHMFVCANITDINACLEQAGITLDFSKCTTFEDFLNNCVTTTFPPVDVSSATTLANIFRYAKKVKKLEIIGVKSTQKWSANCFASCGELAELYISGTIGTSLTLWQSPKLNNESVQSIINDLADLTGGTAQTLTLHATVKNNLTEAQIAQITSKNWTLA